MASLIDLLRAGQLGPMENLPPELQQILAPMEQQTSVPGVGSAQPPMGMVPQMPPTQEIAPRQQAAAQPYTEMRPTAAPMPPPAGQAAPPPVRQMPVKGIAERMRDIGRSVGMSIPDAEAQNETYRALLDKGVDPQMARAAVSNPTMMQQLLPAVFAPKTIVGKEGDRLWQREGENFKDVTPGGGDDMQGKTLTGRVKLAPAFGLKPGTMEYNAYVLNGKMPDVVPDHKAIQDADGKVQMARKLIDDLSEAKRLSSGAYSGAFAGQRAAIVDKTVGGPGGSLDTVNFDNLVQNSILPSLKSTFGARITNADLNYVKQLQASSSMSTDAREAILDRLTERAKQNLGQAEQDSQQLRQGAYYKPGGGASSTSAPLPQSQQRAPQEAAPQQPGVAEGATATNPQTGKRIIFRGGQWQAM